MIRSSQLAFTFITLAGCVTIPPAQQVVELTAAHQVRQACAVITEENLRRTRAGDRTQLVPPRDIRDQLRDGLARQTHLALSFHVIDDQEYTRLLGKAPPTIEGSKLTLVRVDAQYAPGSLMPHASVRVELPSLGVDLLGTYLHPGLALAACAAMHPEREHPLTWHEVGGMFSLMGEAIGMTLGMPLLASEQVMQLPGQAMTGVAAGSSLALPPHHLNVQAATPMPTPVRDHLLHPTEVPQNAPDDDRRGETCWFDDSASGELAAQYSGDPSGHRFTYLLVTHPVGSPTPASGSVDRIVVSIDFENICPLGMYVVVLPVAPRGNSLAEQINGLSVTVPESGWVSFEDF